MGERVNWEEGAIKEGRASCLSAELASILGVLGDLSLLDLLTEGGTVTRSVLTGDTDLSGSATLEREFEKETRKSWGNYINTMLNYLKEEQDEVGGQGRGRENSRERKPKRRKA